MTDRKKPGVAFWMTVALAAGLAYPLSFGPACWLHEWAGIGESGIPTLYFPVIFTARHTEFGDVIKWYATAGREGAKYPAIVFDGHVAWCWDAR
jgi:hypothetical protein